MRSNHLIDGVLHRPQIRWQSEEEAVAAFCALCSSAVSCVSTLTHSFPIQAMIKSFDQQSLSRHSAVVLSAQREVPPGLQYASPMRLNSNDDQLINVIVDEPLLPGNRDGNAVVRKTNRLGEDLNVPQQYKNEVFLFL